MKNIFIYAIVLCSLQTYPMAKLTTSTSIGTYLLFSRANTQPPQLIQSIGLLTNSDPNDLMNAGLISSGLFTANYFVESPAFNKMCFVLGIHSPLATIMTTHPQWHQFMNAFPIIRTYLSCDNDTCKGVCNQCKLKTSVRQAVATLLLAQACGHLPG